MFGRGQDRWLPWLYAALLLGLNLYICRELFTLAYTRFMGSNEGSYMAIARMWLRQPGSMLWWPYWDSGMPIQNTYLPLLPLATAAVAKLAGLTPAVAFHAFSALMYCLGPVALFIMAWQMSGWATASFFVGLLYSLFSPSMLFAAIREDETSIWDPRRLEVLLRYGEAPHTIALTFLPLATWLLFRALKAEGVRQRTFASVWAGIAVALLALTNAFGAAMGAIAAGCLLLAWDRGAFLRNLGLLAAIAGLTYAILSPLVPPWVLESILRNSPTAGGDYRASSATRLVLLAIVAMLFAIRWLLIRIRAPFAVRFSILLAVVVSGIVIAGFLYGIPVIPQPSRYQIDFEMTLWLASVFAAAWAAGRWKKTLAVIGVLLIVASVPQTIHYRRIAKVLLRPIRIEERMEYRQARWFAEHFPGQRIAALGSTGLWLNVFADNPQFGTGHEPTSVNWMNRVAVYTVESGQNAGTRDGEISLAWLRLHGVRAIAVAGPNTGTQYHAITNPNKFEGLLPVLWKEGDDTIYGIPQRPSNLVHVIPREAAIVRAPIHGLDIEPLQPYLAALENPAYPVPEVQWTRPGSATIHAQLRPGQLLSVQTNYHPGWHAVAKGNATEVRADAVGFLVVDPGCDGDCVVQLDFNGGLPFHETLVTSVIGLLLAAGLLTRAVRRTSRK